MLFVRSHSRKVPLGAGQFRDGSDLDLFRFKSACSALYTQGLKELIKETNKKIQEEL